VPKVRQDVCRSLERVDVGELTVRQKIFQLVFFRAFCRPLRYPIAIRSECASVIVD